MTTTTAAWTGNDRDHNWSSPDQDDAALNFHRTLNGYEPTALIELPELARELGVAAVFAKDESTRLGMPAFKALGASWAVHRALEAAQADTDAEVVTATDGNHGRAVARFAREAGRPARIFVPAGGIHPSAVAAIRGEGAEVVESEANYDQSVEAAADYAAANGGVLVQDTAWDGYEEVPGWIVDGYSTLFREIDAQLSEAGHHAPDLITVPTGVGSLLQAALARYRRTSAGGDASGTGASGAADTAVVSVETEAAACMGPSLDAGHPVTVETGNTIMSGLNCGTPSSLEWPLARDGLDAAVTVGDAAAIDAAHRLADLGVAAGPCGAASLAGVREALAGVDAESRRRHLGVDSGSVIVLTVTEGSAANPVPDA
ncbi:diaminopropionate ammonia-lyase [Brevibacterium iodinum ATCC 49514]|uniref:Diaminopropionate ammonia-lyase n=1 Tax=Brevibacterium iodinum ATCC 49514 TaxID=1255616 RepID=A0A2H1J6X2_9MICO|nr:pyridoxal-phosphate dependent enzyme [Brevibacterium iodinum]SMX82932.1 diaminopropionate ammonia-lyase [Brevibacterium iodinum ATCC 49514]SUW14274.1 Diaminopropionate ammonia-lyase [Brevibacterium iodinum]